MYSNRLYGKAIHYHIPVYKISVHIRGLHELATFKGGHRTLCVRITSGRLLCGGVLKDWSNT